MKKILIICGDDVPPSGLLKGLDDIEIVKAKEVDVPRYLMRPQVEPIELIETHFVPDSIPSPIFIPRHKRAKGFRK